MAVATVRFGCGHQQKLTGAEQSPACGTCGNRTVVHVKAPAPSFRGHCRGPHAQYEALPAVHVALGAKDTADAIE